MRKLIVFNHISLDGYIADSNSEMNWAHNGSNDSEYREFMSKNSSQGDSLVFGRKTFDLMASFWPTPLAAEVDRDMALKMNSLQKFVFSRTLKQVDWNNTKLLKGEIVSELRNLKNQLGRAIVILGSGNLLSQIVHENLIDQYQMILNPIILGGGKSFFEGFQKPVPMKLIQSHSFRNGKVFLRYEPE